MIVPNFMLEEVAQEEDDYGHPLRYKGNAKLLESYQVHPGQNCHGYVVTKKKLLKGISGDIGIQDSLSMDQIIKDAVTARLIRKRGPGERPRAQDIVIYGNYIHSGIVNRVVNGVPEVISDWGDFGVYKHSVNDLERQYQGLPHTYYGPGK